MLVKVNIAEWNFFKQQFDQDEPISVGVVGDAIMGTVLDSAIAEADDDTEILPVMVELPGNGTLSLKVPIKLVFPVHMLDVKKWKECWLP